MARKTAVCDRCKVKMVPVKEANDQFIDGWTTDLRCPKCTWRALQPGAVISLFLDTAYAAFEIERADLTPIHLQKLVRSLSGEYDPRVNRPTGPPGSTYVFILPCVKTLTKKEAEQWIANPHKSVPVDVVSMSIPEKRKSKPKAKSKPKPKAASRAGKRGS